MIVTVLTGWFALAFGLGILVGRSIRHADRQQEASQQAQQPARRHLVVVPDTAEGSR